MTDIRTYDMDDVEDVKLVLMHLFRRNPIRTVKAIKQLSNCGLIEAKQSMDHVRNMLPPAERNYVVSFGLDGAYGYLTRHVSATDYDDAEDKVRQALFPVHIVDVQANLEVVS